MGTEDQDYSMAEDVITQALEAARKRATLAEQERASLDRAIASAREEQRLLEKLLALRRDGLTGSNQNPITGLTIARPDANSTSPLKTGRPVLEVVVEELGAAGRPLHISELMRLLRDRDVQIPGSGKQANLITHLRRDARVVRPSRGMYALAVSGLQNMPVSRQRRRRRKHRRSTKDDVRSHP
jgi:hypothetical protein